MRERIILCLVFFGFSAVQIGAQTKPEPPRRTPPARTGIAPADTVNRAEKPLPPIELPEYDITGKLIPGVAESGKGEIGGSGGLDPLGRGTLRNREAGWADPSVWKEGASLSEAAGARTARVEAGYGSFISPFIEASVWPSAEGRRIGVGGAYKTTDGHVENADEKRGQFSASAGWELGGDGGALNDASLDLFTVYTGRNYHPFGSLNPGEGRSFNRFAVGAGLSGVAFGDVSAGGKLVLGSASIAGDETIRHTRFGFEGTGSMELSEVELQGGIEGSLSSFENLSGESSPYLFRFTLLAARKLTPEVEVQAGLSGSAFRGSKEGGSGRLFPLAAVTWFVGNGLDLTLRYEPTVREGNLEALGLENPYLAYSTQLRHEIDATDISVVAQFTPQRAFRVRLVTQYQRFTPYLAFADTAGLGVWETYDAGVSKILTLRGDILWEPTRADLFSVTIRGITSTNSVTEASVPYLPSLKGEVAYSHRFPFGLIASADFQMMGSRQADLNGDVMLDPFILTTLSAEYPILPRLRLRGWVGNLFGAAHEWWLGYSGLPRNAGLALSYSW
jgi:hypothetical protein